MFAYTRKVGTVVVVISSPAKLGEVIRARRIELGRTQSQLAARAGVSRWWITQIEAGKPRAELGLILKVLYTLDLTLKVDTGHEPPPHDDAINLDKLLDEYGA